MSETLRWDFVGNDRLTDLLEKLDRTLGKVDRSLDGVGRTSVKTTAKVAPLKEEVKKTGDESEKTERKLKKAFTGLGPEIAKTKAELHALQQEFARTGDEDLVKKISKHKSTLSDLESAKNDLEKWGKDAAIGAGSAFAKAFPEGLSGGFSAMPTEVKAGALAIGGAVALTVAPVILSAVAGAVLGGVGIGGIVGGVALASKDARVQQAWTALGRSAGPVMTALADPFIEPLIAVPARLTAALTRESPRLKAIFADSAENVLPLVDGLIGLAERALPGIEHAVHAAGPLLETIGHELPNMGDALDKFFDSMANSGPGAAQSLTGILRAVENITVGFGQLVEQNARAVEVGSKLLTPGVAEYLGIAPQVHQVGRELHDSAGAITEVGDAAKYTGVAMDVMSAAYDRFVGNSMDSTRAAIAYQQQIADTTKQLENHKRTLDITTATGQANTLAILDAVQAAERLRVANQDGVGGAAAANAAYHSQIEGLVALMRHLGYTEQDIDNLIGAARRVPSELPINVHVTGLGRALADIGQIVAAAGGIGLSAGLNPAPGKKKKRALGGAVTAGELYQVHEQGSAGMAEYFQPSMPGTIRTGSGAGGGGDVLQPIVLQLDSSTVWQGLLRFKSATGKVSLELG